MIYTTTTKHEKKTHCKRRERRGRRDIFHSRIPPRFFLFSSFLFKGVVIFVLFLARKIYDNDGGIGQFPPLCVFVLYTYISRTCMLFVPLVHNTLYSVCVCIFKKLLLHVRTQEQTNNFISSDEQKIIVCVGVVETQQNHLPSNSPPPYDLCVHLPHYSSHQKKRE